MNLENSMVQADDEAYKTVEEKLDKELKNIDELRFYGSFNIIIDFN